MRSVMPAIVLMSFAAIATAATNPATPTCAATNGVHRVSAAAATCCLDLPCQLPRSFDTVPPPRHKAHT